MANDLYLCSLHVPSSVLGADAGGALLRTKLEGALDLETSVVGDYLADMLGVTRKIGALGGSKVSSA